MTVFFILIDTLWHYTRILAEEYIQCFCVFLYETFSVNTYGIFISLFFTVESSYFIFIL